MRKDSELFLKQVLAYRKEIGQDSFDINISYFKAIPNITMGIKDTLKDLINNNCLTSQSVLLNLEYDIAIYLTLDGITYFDDVDSREKQSKIVFNVSGGQVNIANDNGKINTIVKNTEDEENRKEDSRIIRNTAINMNKSSKTETRKKVFVSYSWIPERNKKWVKELVQKLENDGIQVVIDFKDLKLGHDKFAFMERMVNDVSIDKVLIICNKSYKEKADNRSGGVGDESVIITPQLYGDVRQEKFIPVVNEYDEERKPCLPNYLSSRMYADLTEFGKGYEELLDNILGDSRRKFSEEQSEPLVIKDIDAYDLPAAFFDYRFGKAFPGIRGMQEFDVPGECIDRLEILLRNPLRAKKRNMVDPIWWLRGSSNMVKSWILKGRQR